MYYFEEFAKKYNLEKQLPDFKFVIRDDRMLMDSVDYRLDVYGWPDNRVVVSNKITGLNTIKRFGPKGTESCRSYLMTCLEVLGADMLEGDWDQEEIDRLVSESLCEDCKA